MTRSYKSLNYPKLHTYGKMAPRYRSPQLLPSKYGLNRSLGKMLYIGLENSAAGSPDFMPVVQMCEYHKDNMFTFGFTMAMWRCFTANFPRIDEWFTTNVREKEPIRCVGFDIKFSIVYDDKAFCVERVLTRSVDSSPPPSKRSKGAADTFQETYVQRMTLKRNTFEYLKLVARCVDIRMSYLKRVENALPTILSVFASDLKDQIVASEESQFTYFTADNVLSAMNEYKYGCIDKIESALSEKNLSVFHDDILLIITECVTYHLYNIVALLNE